MFRSRLRTSLIWSNSSKRKPIRLSKWSMTTKGSLRESKLYKSWRIRGRKRQHKHRPQGTSAVDTSREITPLRYNRLKRSLKRSMTIFLWPKRSWSPKFKKMRWWTLRYSRLRKNSKRKKKQWKSRSMTFRRESISLTRTSVKKRMNARSCEKNLRW